MLRRSAQSLLPKLWQAQGASGFAPLAAAFNHLPGCSFQSDSPSAARPYASTTELVGLANTGGLPPTVYAMKNPTPDITYDTANHQRFAPGPGDDSKRAFTYFVLTGGRFIGAAAVRLAVLKFVLSMTVGGAGGAGMVWRATKDVLAMANLEVDIANIQPGNEITVKWRGKPVFIRHRSEEDIAKANAVEVSSLRDPQADAERVIKPEDTSQGRFKPEWLILVGVCTHLGCVPLPNAGDYQGGSHYDTSGRIRKGPAPYNLEVPAYQFMSDTHCSPAARGAEQAAVPAVGPG
ncbi:hypothetical protein N2152v2_002083 [Parachlorella kessleri]